MSLRLKITLIFFATIGIVHLFPWQYFQNELNLNLFGDRGFFYGNLPKLIIEGDTSTCENSVQGKYFVTDSRGFICSRNDVNRTNGCCNSFINYRAQNFPVKFFNSNLRNSNFTGWNNKYSKQYDCTHCVSSCCEEYENCISCCLNPVNLRKYLYAHISAPALHGIVISDSNLITQLQTFGYCKHICRTNSKSVQTENSYRGFHNHCFSQQQSLIEKYPVNSDRAGFRSGLKEKQRK